jgi:hypothetical protein
MTTAQTLLRRAGAFVTVSLLAACAGQRPAPVETPPAPTTSVAQADERLAAVAAERLAIEARYAEREAVCYDKFFVNNCLDEAKERRRLALAAQRTIEVEAEYFKRKNKVEERDKAMAETEAKFQAEEAASAAQPVVPRTISPPPPPRRPTVPDRIAKRDARAAQEAAQEPANAAARAANAAAFEERRRKSEERQREVAQRKAERAAKQAAEKAEKEKAGQAAPVPAR